MNSEKLHYLTPVQQVDGMLFKREDLYAPFGAGEVNGGKLRQCMLLVNKIHESYDGLLTCCSIHSPQAPITAATAKAFGMRCEVLYGGTTKERLMQLQMPRLVLRYGAQITIAGKCGRSKVLYYIAQRLQREKGNRDYIIQYGINLTEHEDILLGAVAEQVRNIPDEINNLVLTCGSGITAIGVLAGIKQYRKQVRNVHLVATAPDRRQMIHKALQKYGADRDFHYHDLFHTRGFSYEEPFCSIWGGIKLHPNYEAKTMAWFVGSGLRPEETLFWITGAEPSAAK
jgi:1-aminocyclopropane-1-carboxylate deaminase/D-cysteine desulfhydrase-like pyridoxal-dependent ACC family enzyme